jgi:hypothetical protein
MESINEHKEKKDKLVPTTADDKPKTTTVEGDKETKQKQLKVETKKDDAKPARKSVVPIDILTNCLIAIHLVDIMQQQKCNRICCR